LDDHVLGPEARARRNRIEPRLAALGWRATPCGALPARASWDRLAIEEYPTTEGPADYALAVGGKILGVVEAKRLSLGPQNVLTQVERYSRGATDNPFDFGGCHVPFLYSTNGEVIWFHDVRHALNRSRKIAVFHKPEALAELLTRDFDAEIARLAALLVELCDPEPNLASLIPRQVREMGGIVPIGERTNGLPGHHDGLGGRGDADLARVIRFVASRSF
jgi:hypothetical protein